MYKYVSLDEICTEKVRNYICPIYIIVAWTCRTTFYYEEGHPSVMYLFIHAILQCIFCKSS